MTKIDRAKNYLKLSLRTSVPIDLAGSRPTNVSNVNARPGVLFTTSWVFPFTGKAEGGEALIEAQAMRKALKDANQHVDPEAFQLSTFKASTLRGVSVIGNLTRAILSVAS